MGVGKKAHKKSKSFLSSHRFIRYSLLIIGGLVAAVFLLWFFNTLRTTLLQRQLDPFYKTDELVSEGQLGEIVRQEPIKQKVDGGSGKRILYRTQKADGSYAFSSGMVFIPDSPALGDRPIVALAHGTLGFGDVCAG